MVKGHVPFVRTTLLLDDYTEEESRRIVAFTVVPEDGVTPVRIYQKKKGMPVPRTTQKNLRSTSGY